MREIKFTTLFIFLIAFIGGRATGSVLQNDSKKAQTESSKFNCKITQEDQDEDSPLKRKHRPRGIEVDVPNIAGVCFEQSFSYQILKTYWTDNIYTSFLYHVDLKRGPPRS